MFLADSSGWPAATLYDQYHAPGRPHGLHVDSEALLDSFVDLDEQAGRWLKEQHVDVRTLDLICVHQPSVPFVDTFLTRMGIDAGRVVPTFSHRKRGRGHPPPPTGPGRPRPPPDPR
ncbi:hypothetical protein AB0K23_32755 [Streptomyces sp. NPDC049602]|uniref:hypothetical protein n=1 Tax=Streptomyces sp. NPDC049602 TaxID=3155504 RepID=UPI00343EE1A7